MSNYNNYTEDNLDYQIDMKLIENKDPLLDLTVQKLLDYLPTLKSSK